MTTSPSSPQPSAFMGAAEALDPVLKMILGHLPSPGSHIDLGSGRGRLLALSKAAGNDVFGVDDDEDSVALCVEQGLEVVLADALKWLSGFPRRVDGISAIHFIEHLEPKAADELIAIAADRLRVGGRLAIVTPNFRDWTVAREIFWLDPTHVRPYPIPLLLALGQRHQLKPILARNVVGVEGMRRAKLGYPLKRLVHGRDYGRMNSVIVLEKE